MIMLFVIRYGVCWMYWKVIFVEVGENISSWLFFDWVVCFGVYIFLFGLWYVVDVWFFCFNFWNMMVFKVLGSFVKFSVVGVFCRWFFKVVVLLVLCWCWYGDFVVVYLCIVFFEECIVDCWVVWVFLFIDVYLYEWEGEFVGGGYVSNDYGVFVLVCGYVVFVLCCEFMNYFVIVFG